MKKRESVFELLASWALWIAIWCGGIVARPGSQILAALVCGFCCYFVVAFTGAAVRARERERLFYRPERTPW